MVWGGWLGWWNGGELCWFMGCGEWWLRWVVFVGVGLCCSLCGESVTDFVVWECNVKSLTDSIEKVRLGWRVSG